jgi:hypothetical protein
MFTRNSNQHIRQKASACLSTGATEQGTSPRVSIFRPDELEILRPDLAPDYVIVTIAISIPRIHNPGERAAETRSSHGSEYDCSKEHRKILVAKRTPCLCSSCE